MNRISIPQCGTASLQSLRLVAKLPASSRAFPLTPPEASTASKASCCQELDIEQDVKIDVDIGQEVKVDVDVGQELDIEQEATTYGLNGPNNNNSKALCIILIQ